MVERTPRDVLNSSEHTRRRWRPIRRFFWPFPPTFRQKEAKIWSKSVIFGQKFTLERPWGACERSERVSELPCNRTPFLGPRLPLQRMAWFSIQKDKILYPAHPDEIRMLRPVLLTQNEFLTYKNTLFFKKINGSLPLPSAPGTPQSVLSHSQRTR